MKWLILRFYRIFCGNTGFLWVNREKSISFQYCLLKFAYSFCLDIFANMELDYTLKQSLLNLEKSFDALDNALMKQGNSATGNDGMADELNMLNEDKNHLAAQLDKAKAKIRMFETVNQQIENRVDTAMQQLSSLLIEDGDR